MNPPQNEKQPHFTYKIVELSRRRRRDFPESVVALDHDADGIKISFELDQEGIYRCYDMNHPAWTWGFDLNSDMTAINRLASHRRWTCDESEANKREPNDAAMVNFFSNAAGESVLFERDTIHMPNSSEFVPQADNSQSIIVTPAKITKLQENGVSDLHITIKSALFANDSVSPRVVYTADAEYYYQNDGTYKTSANTAKAWYFDEESKILAHCSYQEADTKAQLDNNTVHVDDAGYYLFSQGDLPPNGEDLDGRIPNHIAYLKEDGLTPVLEYYAILQVAKRHRHHRVRFQEAIQNAQCACPPKGRVNTRPNPTLEMLHFPDCSPGQLSIHYSNPKRFWSSLSEMVIPFRHVDVEKCASYMTSIVPGQRPCDTVIYGELCRPLRVLLHALKMAGFDGWKVDLDKVVVLDAAKVEAVRCYGSHHTGFGVLPAPLKKLIHKTGTVH